MSRGTPPGDRGRLAIIALPTIWLGAMVALPLLIILRMSLSQPASAQPPYRPLLDIGAGWEGLRTFLAGLNFDNYVTLLTDDLYVSVLLTSLRIAALGALLTLLVGYPIAYAMAKAPRSWRPQLIALIVLPFWTSFLIRVYAWIAILKQEGLLNQLLIGLGVIAAPLELLNTEWAIQIGIVYSYLPFMVLPIYAVLEKHDPSLVEAAGDLGAPPSEAFWLVTVPLSLPGVVAGVVLVFIPVMGEFIIPDLLGGSDTLMLGRQIWSEFFSNRDWPLASAIAMALLALIAAPLLMAESRQNREPAR
ncbi:MAG: ABC transporter permease [Beijerinckiaceae bacterium]